MRLVTRILTVEKDLVAPVPIEELAMQLDIQSSKSSKPNPLKEDS